MYSNAPLGRSFFLSLKKRNRISKVANNSKSYPALSFGQAIDLFATGKRIEGVCDRTINDYGKMWRYFTEWIEDNYEIETVDQLTIDMIQNYIHYMKYDKKKYTGHKYIDADKQEIGLSDTTININLRSLKARSILHD